MAVEEVTIPVTFIVGKAEELPQRYYMSQMWVDGEREGMKFDLTCGAGVGNPFMNASGRIAGEKAIHAQTDITEMVSAIWDAISERLKND